MPAKRDRVRLTVEVLVYVILGWVAMSVAGWATVALGGYLVGITLAVFSSALFVNWLTLSIYEHKALAAIGLHLSRAGGDNLLFGFAGGAGAACLSLIPALIAGAAQLRHDPAGTPTAGTF